MTEAKIVITAFIILTIFATLPIIYHLDWVSSQPDESVYLWMMWWYKKSVLSLQNPVHTTYTCAPTGLSLWFQNMVPLASFASIPLQFFLNLEVIFNIFMLASFILSGFFTYLLTEKLTSNRYAAFISGVMFAFWSGRFTYYKWAEINLISTQWIPLTIYLQLKGLTEKNKSYTIGAGIALAFTGLSHWEYLPATAISCILIYINHCFKNKKLIREYAVHILLLALTGFLITSPYLVPMIFETMHEDYMYVKEDLGDMAGPFGADISMYVMPHTGHKYFGEKFKDNYDKIPILPGSNFIYLGILPILFAVIGFSLNRKYLFWLFYALFFALISFGPSFQYLGVKVTENPVYGLYCQLPFISVGRTPIRNALFVMLGFSIMAGYGVTRLFNIIKQPRMLTTLTIIISVLAMMDGIIPLDYKPGLNHELFEGVNATEGKAMHLPLYRWTSYYTATFHELPHLNCKLPRGRDELHFTRRLYDMQRTLYRLHNPHQISLKEFEKYYEKDKSLMEKYDISVITVEESRIKSEESIALENYLGRLGYHKHSGDNTLSVYLKT
jgi:hypothetical protein